MISICSEVAYDSAKTRAVNLGSLKTNKQCRLVGASTLVPKPLIPIPFPQCADLLLSQLPLPVNPGSTEDTSITEIFSEYFSFGKHTVGLPANLRIKKGQPFFDVYETLRNCAKMYPAPYCLPPSCIKLDGIRNLDPQFLIDYAKKIKRLFIGDLVWLFYFERMGIFKIIGVILDDFAIQGKYPLPIGSPEGMILEAMVRLTKNGMASSVRDRDSTYRRCLGWTSDAGRTIGSKAEVNYGFNDLFHKFIQLALQYYRDKRLAVAIQAQVNVSPKPSVATLTSIGDTINLLRKSSAPFLYGRNYYNTLNGIVWIIAGLDLIQRLKSEIGIPQNYKAPHEYIPAAYNLLVEKGPITQSVVNRYQLHKESAIDARDLLLDIEALYIDDKKFAQADGELEIWLDYIEDRIEGYRSDYQSLTGIDLATESSPKIEQKV